MLFYPHAILTAFYYKRALLLNVLQYSIQESYAYHMSWAGIYEM